MSSTATTTAPRPPRRSALLVGINYNTIPDATLSGCYNDVVNVSQYLRLTLGYSPNSIAILTDGNRGAVGTASRLPPTRKNIIDGISALVTGMVAGDEAVFHYSGHGSLVRDTNGDEASGLDSCLCPLDYNIPASAGGGMITDDDIRALLVNKVPRGARLYVILDCCHNGTGCDIRYRYEDFSVLLSPPSARTPVWRTLQRAYLQGKYTETAGDVYMISGCRDEQTSADAYINNAFAGALTYAVFSILRANQGTIRTYSWSALLRDVRHFMRTNKYTQIPQLMTGQLISPNRPVFAGVSMGVPIALVGRGGPAIELTSSSVIPTGSRGVEDHDTKTLFTFKPSFGSQRANKVGIQFIH